MQIDELLKSSSSIEVGFSLERHRNNEGHVQDL